MGATATRAMTAAGGLVTVVGALNMDLVVAVPQLPGPGQTVLGDDLQRHPGGKGANQAVAARRAGAEVRMVGAVGADDDGRALLADLRTEGIDTGAVASIATPTGTALISVDPGGENQIVVAPGANAALAPSPAAVGAAVSGARVVLASFEVPMRVVVAVATSGRNAGAEVVINPAPFAELPPALLELDPIVVPNEHELAQLTGVEAVDRAVARLRRAGWRRVVVTRGADGCTVLDGERSESLPPYRVAPVLDTTGAGDAFCGVLASWLAGGSTLTEAAAAANVAAALSVRSRGARTGMPHRAEIVAALRDL